MYSTLHDVIRDVERKKERKAPEAMETCTCTVHYMYSTSYVHV